MGFFWRGWWYTRVWLQGPPCESFSCFAAANEVSRVLGLATRTAQISLSVIESPVILGEVPMY